MTVSGAQLFVSPRASLRRAKALSFLRARGAGERLLIVGASVEAAAELVRDAAREPASGAVRRIAAGFGWHRFSLGRLASTLAAPELARRGLVPIGGLSHEALCARLLDEAARGRAKKGEPVSGVVFDASLPGAARALSKTLCELRLAGVEPARVAEIRPELGQLLAALEESLARGHFADRALVLQLAKEQLARSELCGHPIILLEVPLGSLREAELVAALASRAELLALVPEGDAQTLAQLARTLALQPIRLVPEGADPLSRMQRSLFAPAATDRRSVDGLNSNHLDSLELFSAPGEGRECVEIARRILAAAKLGVPFDRMAVLLRQPALYRPLLEEALARAQIPAWFARGTSRPDPAGRAFLALLACADEGLSARRFAEYLSLGEVPAVDAEPPSPAWTPPAPGEELLASAVARTSQEAASAAPAEVPARPSWRWEPLLIDAAVIGGREVDNPKARWKNRLASHRLELKNKEELLLAENEERALAFRRQREDLDALWSYAEPILERLSALPREASWGVWLPALDALAAASLRTPAPVRSLLAQLLPLGEVGPVSLAEVQLLLSRELGELPEPPAAHREGKLFVGPIESARGLSFAQVFAPALAERLFPAKALQDPLLRDRDRAHIDPFLANESQRVSHERLQLRLAAGAAEEKLCLSWPRLELQQGRARVPSFYGLEALSAAEGILPGFAELSRRAERAGDARAGWPAPDDPRNAIDAAEHDLSLLGWALHKPEAETRGILRYLLGVNTALKRALHRRAERERKRWFHSDGLVDPSPEALEAMKAHQLDARSFSASALQNFSSCPYKFFLQAIHRLEPREEPQPIDEIDPLSRGSLMHEVQFKLFNSLRAESVLPLYHADTSESARRLALAQARLEEILAPVAARYHDELVPVIARVWDDCIASIKGDLREWLRRVAGDPRWVPTAFELAFGLPPEEGRDARSTPLPVQLAGGLQLRGSIDLVERDGENKLRATDYKSGKQWAKQEVIIQGGKTLQPVLYALALEKLFAGAQAPQVVGGQLFYCTHAGNYTEVPVPLDLRARDAELLLARTVGDALRDGFFPAAPEANACARCDYLEICGDGEEARSAKKPKERLIPLNTLRGHP